MNYQEMLAHGCAYSPEWTPTAQGFRWSVILTPVGVDTINSDDDYLDYLALRVAFHIDDWITRYVDEMDVDPDNAKSVWIGTLQLIESYIPELDFDLSMNSEQVADLVVRFIPNRQAPNSGYPAACADSERSRDLADCIRSEITLEGWLIEVFS